MFIVLLNLIVWLFPLDCRVSTCSIYMGWRSLLYFLFFILIWQLTSSVCKYKLFPSDCLLYFIFFSYQKKNECFLWNIYRPTRVMYGQLPVVFLCKSSSMSSPTNGVILHSPNNNNHGFRQQYQQQKQHYQVLDLEFFFLSMLAHDVIWTSIQPLLNVMDVIWTSKQRCVLAGLILYSLSDSSNYLNESRGAG